MCEEHGDSCGMFIHDLFNNRLFNVPGSNKSTNVYEHKLAWNATSESEISFTILTLEMMRMMMKLHWPMEEGQVIHQLLIWLPMDADK